MQVSFNPNTNYNYTNFSGKKSDKSKKEVSYLTESEKNVQDIRSTRVKTAVKICVAAAIGLDIIYFATKRTFNVNKAKALQEKSKKVAEMAVPTIMRPKVATYLF